MFDAVLRARRVVSLAGRVPLLRESAAEWLVALRWVAVGGMLATILTARRLVPGLGVTPLVAILALIAASNVAWSFAVEHGRRWVGAQLAVDVLTLSAMLWFSGGIANPFAGFLTFQIALAGVLTRGSTTAMIAALVIACSDVLFFAPPLPWATAVVSADQLRQLAYLACVTGLGTFMGFSAYIYGSRLDALNTARARDERLAMAGRLAGSMAHELNTPLATILLASNELAFVGRESKDAEVSTLARTVAQEAQRASDIIELLRGRVREGTSSRMLDLSAFVEEVAKEELARLRFDGAITLAVGAKIQAWGGSAAIRQILANVLRNAVEAMVGVPHKRLEIVVADVGDRVNVRVRDSGQGIATDDLQRLGEPFQTTKELAGGMGLGLYVSTMLAEQMGARLQIESHEGEETCVTLALRRGPGLAVARRSGDDSAHDDEDSDDGHDEIEERSDAAN